MAEYRDFVYFPSDHDDPKVSEFANRVDYSSQVWYFVVADCRQLTFERTEGGLSVKQVPFTLNLELMNGDSHFSEEESGWLTPLLVF